MGLPFGKKTHPILLISNKNVFLLQFPANKYAYSYIHKNSIAHFLIYSFTHFHKVQLNFKSSCFRILRHREIPADHMNYKL